MPLLAPPPPAPPTAPAGAFDRLGGVVSEGYSVRLRWDPATRRLEGAQDVAVRDLGGRPVTRVWLRLRANRGVADGVAACDAAAVRPEGRDGAVIEEARDGCSVVAVRPPGTATSTAAFSLGLGIRVPRGEGDLGRSGGVDLVGDAFPTVVVDGGAGLRLRPDPEREEGLLAPAVPWDLTVDVPARVGVVLPGRPIWTARADGGGTHRTHGVLRDPGIALGAMAQRSTRVGAVQVAVAAVPGRASLLPAALREAVRAQRFLSSRYGGRHATDVTVVLGDLPWGGMEYSGVVFSTPDRATIAHEVAHQWFFGAVGNDQYREPWLDESLTVFHEELLAPGTYACPPGERPAGRLAGGMQRFAGDLRRYNDVVYRGGACAFLELRARAGDVRLRRGLRVYVARRAGRVATASDLHRAPGTAIPRRVLDGWWRARVGAVPARA